MDDLARPHRPMPRLVRRIMASPGEATRLPFEPAPGAALSDDVAAELARGAELLSALAPASPAGDAWSRFRERFVARHATREVPLVEVLDEESGLGFGDHEPSPRAAPLLAGLALPTLPARRTAAPGARDLHLVRLVTGALRGGADEIEITDDDVARLSQERPRPLPDVLGVHAVLTAASDGAVAEGRCRLHLSAAGAGASLLDRLLPGSPRFHELTAACLRAEETARPEAIFAEVVQHPRLAASSAGEDRQIGVDDLLVSVAGDRVVLRSRRLGREVIPRRAAAHDASRRGTAEHMRGAKPGDTTQLAHDASRRGTAVHRFLCAYVEQHAGHASWSWGAMSDLPFLPRVRRGRVVLARARWLLTAGDLAPLEAAPAGAAVAELRARLRLPRWIAIGGVGDDGDGSGDGDGELPIDLDDERMVDRAAHLLRSRPRAIVHELLPGPGELAARDGEGSLAHELIVLLARPAPRPAVPHLVTGADADVLAGPAPAPPRRFPPGSSWLDLKLDTGAATADALLRDHLAPAIRQAKARRLVTSWFFVCDGAGDPDLHLRVRFAGDPQRLIGELLPLLHDALAPAVDRGLLWRIAADTYEREVERYGGPAGIVAAEALFSADSEAALALLERCEGDAGADAVWRIALRGIDRLLGDLGLSLADKLAAVTAARDRAAAELGADAALGDRLGERFRAHRDELAELLEAPVGDAHSFAPAFRILAARSRALRPIGEHLRALEVDGRLQRPVRELAHSFVQTHVHRMIRSSPRLHEVVLYDLLHRYYAEIVACARHDQPGLAVRMAG